MNTPRLPPKKDVAIALLEKSSVYVHLDPRHEGVRVPPWLKQRVPLVLQVGLNMAVRIPDLEVGDEALSCTLSFQRRPYFCFIPWSAVYAIVGEDQRGMVWPDDVPTEVAAQAQKQQQVEKRRAAMRQVSGAKESAKGGDAEHPPTTEASVSVGGVDESASRASEPRTPGKPTARITDAEQPDKVEPGRSVEGDAASPTPAGASRSARPEEGKKGRPLPPYLRVVK